MTIRTIRTNKDEAEHILANRMRHIYRASDEHLQPGDSIQFLVYKDGKPIYHKINSNFYVVTMIQDRHTAPVEQGWQIVVFRDKE